MLNWSLHSFLLISTEQVPMIYYFGFSTKAGPVLLRVAEEKKAQSYRSLFSSAVGQLLSKDIDKSNVLDVSARKEVRKSRRVINYWLRLPNWSVTISFSPHFCRTSSYYSLFWIFSKGKSSVVESCGRKQNTKQSFSFVFNS